jgi:hypothetical protein
MVKAMLAAHHCGQEDLTEPIVALLTFELWRQQFQVSIA